MTFFAHLTDSYTDSHFDKHCKELMEAVASPQVKHKTK